MASDNQADAAERIISRYCREIEESGIDRVQILSPFRSEGAASAEQLNEAIQQIVVATIDGKKLRPNEWYGADLEKRTVK